MNIVRVAHRKRKVLLRPVVFYIHGDEGFLRERELSRQECLVLQSFNFPTRPGVFELDEVSKAERDFELGDLRVLDKIKYEKMVKRLKGAT